MERRPLLPGRRGIADGWIGAGARSGSRDRRAGGTGTRRLHHAARGAPARARAPHRQPGPDFARVR